jgi:N-dimethylarginine dimethylaminohydrolase
MSKKTEPFDAAAYGGEGWSARTASLREELGRVWTACGISTEWSRLKAILLHRPGPELGASADPDSVQMLEPLDLERAQAQHDALAAAYRENGVVVHDLDPSGPVSPNQMFVADLMFATPEGAILARPASTIRAGEERTVARRLADLGVPILRSLRGEGTFEGADAAWLDPTTVILGIGLRTNTEGASQVTATLNEMNVDVIQVDMPFGTMHLMGMLRFADRDLAIAWPKRLAHRGIHALKEHGYRVEFIPDEEEGAHGKSLNFVTLGPREIVMAAGNPNTQAFFEKLGMTCHTVEVNELGKAAGAIGCLTGILHRE